VASLRAAPRHEQVFRSLRSESAARPLYRRRDRCRHQRSGRQRPGYDRSDQRLGGGLHLVRSALPGGKSQPHDDGGSDDGSRILELSRRVLALLLWGFRLGRAGGGEGVPVRLGRRMRQSRQRAIRVSRSVSTGRTTFRSRCISTGPLTCRSPLSISETAKRRGIPSPISIGREIC
jgi:hypothetical protein